MKRLAAMPASAAETFASHELTIAGPNTPVSLGSPFSLHDVDVNDLHSKFIAKQRLLRLNELGKGFSIGRPAALGPGSVPASPATAVPEPMSWAMMIAGLTAVGWSVRTLHQRGKRTIAFA